MDTPTAGRSATGSDDHGSGSLLAVTTSAAARRYVSKFLERIGVSLDSVIAADALMVTTELVTNAIRHGGGLTLFHADLSGDALQLSVGDASTRTPTSRRGDPGRPGGYGWPLIQRLTEHIDITLRSDGKTITAVLRLS
ncbi:ATP-binding protein [Streptomyces sp. NPDC048383]|uniref:ATP-binding protein n=1 Tax=Streptomyces sp. NPDC048383 TaxID=3155386 RepID=UPI003418CA26